MRQTFSTIRCLLNLAAYVAAGMGFAVPAQGGTIDAVGAAPAGIDWQWTHQAQGWGRARVFDGGPEQFDYVDDGCECAARIGFDAFDLTRPGTMGASAGALGRSDIDVTDQWTALRVDFRVSYLSSIFSGGDRPGGEAEGEFHTLDDLVLPVDSPLLQVRGLVSRSGTFSGSARFLIENVTQDITLLDTDGFVLTDFIVDGRVGDVIRFTLDAEGQGEGPLGAVSLSWYDVAFDATITVPEPATIVFLLSGLGYCTRRGAASNDGAAGF